MSVSPWVEEETAEEAFGTNTTPTPITPTTTKVGRCRLTL